MEALVARFTIGDLSKSIGIVGDRVWTEGPYGLEPSPPSPFTRMPLRYERAARGIGNPIGVDLATPPMAGARALPNLEPADDENAGDITIGCGPIPSNWTPRRSLLTAMELSWVAEGCRTPVPESFNFGFYNSAPADQQISMLRQGAKIVLENLHPEFPRLETRLPHIRPKAFLIDRTTQRGSEIALRCDTVWLDTDRALAVLIWRGLTDVPSEDLRALGTLAVAAEMKGQDLRFKHIERLLREEGFSSAETESFTMSDASPLNHRYDGFIPPELAGSPAEQAMSQALRKTANLSMHEGAAALPGVVIHDTGRGSSAPPPPPISQIPPTLPSGPWVPSPGAEDAEEDGQNAETVTKKLSVKGVRSSVGPLRASAPELQKTGRDEGDEPSAETVTQKLDVKKARASMASLPSIASAHTPRLADETSNVPTSESPTLPRHAQPGEPAAAPKPLPAAAAKAVRPAAPAAPKPAAPAAPRAPAPAAPKPAAPAAPKPAAPAAPRAPLPAAPSPRASAAPSPAAAPKIAPSAPQAPAAPRSPSPAPRPAITAPPAEPARHSTPPRPALVTPVPPSPSPSSPSQLPPKPAMVAAPHQQTTMRLLSLQDYARVEAGLERGDIGAVLSKFKLDPEGLDANRAHWKDQIRSSHALSLLFEEALEAARWE